MNPWWFGLLPAVAVVVWGIREIHRCGLLGAVAAGLAVVAAIIGIELLTLEALSRLGVIR